MRVPLVHEGVALLAVCRDHGSLAFHNLNFPAFSRGQSFAAVGATHQRRRLLACCVNANVCPCTHAQVLAFIRATLDPLFAAGLLGREPYRRVAAKGTDRLMDAHPHDTTADFLMREHAQVTC